MTDISVVFLNLNAAAMISDFIWGLLTLSVTVETCFKTLLQCSS